MGHFTQVGQSTLLCCGLVTLLGSVTTPLLAQSSTPIGSDPNANQDINDIFSNRDQGATSLYGLINRLQLLNGRSPGDFAAEQNENFDSALDEFRKKQQQQIQSSPTAPSSSPSSIP